MGTRRATEGFTLIELMVVVAIIAVVAAAAAPAIGAAFRDRKASTATLDVVRTFRGARSAAAGYGRAYMVRFDREANDAQGGLTVTRGVSNRCTRASFAAGSGAETIEDLAYSPERHRISDDFKIVLDNPNYATLDVCYEPTGLTVWRPGGGGAFSTTSPGGGGFVGGFQFTLDRFVGGEREGAVVRRVVVPLGGSARVGR